MSRVIYLSFFLCLVAVAIGSPAAQLNCPEATKCTVTNIDITPCSKKSRCAIKLGKNATINFDFLPEFSASSLKTEVSWQGVAFKGLDPDACKSTACPVTQGTSQPFSYNLYIGKKTPPGNYDIKWKVWNSDNTEDLCCFITKLNVGR